LGPCGPLPAGYSLHMATVPHPPRAALLAGATGLVGRELLQLLLASERYWSVHVLLRGSSRAPAAHPKLTLHPVDFAHLDPLPKVDDVYIALGTTIKIAGSDLAFRGVDFTAVVNTARAARAAGARRLAVVSALGADAASRVFYNRVKGEMQAAVAALDFDSVAFAQPSLLLGDRGALGQPARSGEVWATRLLGPVMGLVPRGVRPIQARAVAQSMLAATLEGRKGVHVLDSGAMQSAHPR
jgi:uncharacterized protein YbjT (DUF2867 family)